MCDKPAPSPAAPAPASSHRWREDRVRPCSGRRRARAPPPEDAAGSSGHHGAPLLLLWTATGARPTLTSPISATVPPWHGRHSPSLAGPVDLHAGSPLGDRPSAHSGDHRRGPRRARGRCALCTRSTATSWSGAYPSGAAYRAHGRHHVPSHLGREQV